MKGLRIRHAPLRVWASLASPPIAAILMIVLAAALVTLLKQPIMGFLNVLPSNTTTAISGVLCLISAVAVAVSAKAVGPDMRAFPCAHPVMRFIAGGCAFGFFIRGTTLLRTLSGPEARHAHWDMVHSWVWATALYVGVLITILSQRAAPGVHEARARRNRMRLKRAQELEHHGGHFGGALAELSASGFTVVAPYEGVEAESDLLSFFKRKTKVPTR